MKMNSLTLNGYRRFNTKQRIQLEGRVTAILGPNEAGKTSILSALSSVAVPGALVTSGPSSEISKSQEYQADHQVLTLKCLLSDDDKKELDKITEAKDAKWIFITKRFGGNAPEIVIKPDVIRNKSARNELLTEIEMLLPDLKPMVLENGTEQEHSLVAPLSNFKNALDSEIQVETVSAQVKKLAQVALKTMVQDENSSFSDNQSKIEQWVTIEHQTHPAELANQCLVNSLPQFVLFSDEHRNLEAEYNLDQMLTTNPKGIPSALDNLATVAGLDLVALENARGKNDQSTIKELTDDANLHLEEQWEGEWNQSGVGIGFRLDGPTLHLVTRDNRSLALDQRSTGIQLYFALFAFIASRADPDRDIVLLVDEAEQHLHYDAQADLIQMFSSQDIATQVVYTTHSIGCLPEDFGMGIRTVESIEDNWSEINNCFWDSPEDGLKPLLYGMGAATMAFLPVRCGVFTEGAVDMLLYPSLLREANEIRHLGFQLTHGLSEVNDDRLAVLQRQATRVAYVVDGDEGGRKLRPKLDRANVSENLIIDLKKMKGPALEVEDFVDKEIFAFAVNEEFRRSNRNEELAVDDVSDQSRTVHLKSWCEEKGIPMPNKTAIAYRILEFSADRPIVADDRIDSLKYMYKRLVTIFDLDRV